MKKLNTIFSFVLLSFCLLVNVSFAEFTLTPMSSGQVALFDSVSTSTALAGYNYEQIRTITVNHFSDVTNTDNATIFNTMIDAFNSKGYSFVIVKNDENNQYIATLSGVNISVGARYLTSTNQTVVYTTRVDTSISSDSFVRTIRFYKSGTVITGSAYTVDGSPNYVYGTHKGTLIYSNVDVKEIIDSGGPTWDGSSYFYKVSSPEQPENPTMPTNAEIASAVQMFYNSDYYKNATDFDKFIVLYDNTTGLYSFIGHTIPEFLQQTIIPPNYRYQDYIFDVQWWKFELSENSGAPAYGSPYYLYTIDNKLENLEYRGKSTISSLVESGPWSTSNTIIVYSNYDYLVRTYVLDEETGDYVYTDGTIAGNQYTYDENLDITDNQYNPLDNFISINYPSTLVGNADFDSFFNTFNENKDVLILPQNANWVILANNSLFSHFSSFIIMCTLFIILQRVMRG